jgi:hypothetical protein
VVVEHELEVTQSHGVLDMQQIAVTDPETGESGSRHGFDPFVD